MYDLTFDSGYRCLFELDVRQLLQKYWEQKEISSSTALTKGPSPISSQPSWQKEKIADDEQESVAALEPGTSVLGIFFIRNPEQPSAVHNDVGIHEVLFGSQSGAAME